MEPYLEQPPPGPAPVAAVVALKVSESAKSRLSTLPDPLRRRLAWSMAVDTLHALEAVAAAVCVVSDQPSLTARLRRAGLVRTEVLPEHRRAGLNEALRQGAAHLQRQGHAAVLACVGDLPALRPDSLRTVLAAAAAYERAHLPDAGGTGTTMLHSRGGPLLPHFQGRSAAAHESSGSVPLTTALPGEAVPDARRDVDTETDLTEAVRLGLGPATAALVDPATDRLARYSVVTVAVPMTPEGEAVTAGGVRVGLNQSAVADGLRPLRVGQRLHAVLSEGTVLSAWL